MKRIIRVLGIRKAEIPYSENRDTPIRKTGIPYSENRDTPIRKTGIPYSENREDNNTCNNTCNNNTREKRAHEFLKENFTYRFETVEMQNKKQIKNWDDLLDGFSDKVEIEDLEWSEKVLFARLNSYIRNWRINTAKEQSQNPEPTKPVYLRKIS